MLLLIKISSTFVLCNLSRPRLGHSLQYETERWPDSHVQPSLHSLAFRMLGCFRSTGVRSKMQSMASWVGAALGRYVPQLPPDLGWGIC